MVHGARDTGHGRKGKAGRMEWWNIGKMVHGARDTGHGRKGRMEYWNIGKMEKQKTPLTPSTMSICTTQRIPPG
jgi:hypothetical protein